MPKVKKKRDKILHISDKMHKKFKQFCLEKDLTLGEATEKALISFITGDTK